MYRVAIKIFPNILAKNGVLKNLKKFLARTSIFSLVSGRKLPKFYDEI